MFGIGLPELILILVLGLIILGPHRIPELAKSIGKGIAELRRMSEDVKGTIEKEFQQESDAAQNRIAPPKIDPEPPPEEKPPPRQTETLHERPR